MTPGWRRAVQVTVAAVGLALAVTLVVRSSNDTDTVLHRSTPTSEPSGGSPAAGAGDSDPTGIIPFASPRASTTRRGGQPATNPVLTPSPPGVIPGGPAPAPSAPAATVPPGVATTAASPTGQTAGSPTGPTGPTGPPATTGSTVQGADPAVPQGIIDLICAAVRSSGSGPLRRGQDGYSPILDPDGNGLACD